MVNEIVTSDNRGASECSFLGNQNELQAAFDAIDTSHTGTIHLEAFMNCNFIRFENSSKKILTLKNSQVLKESLKSYTNDFKESLKIYTNLKK